MRKNNLKCDLVRSLITHKSTILNLHAIMVKLTVETSLCIQRKVFVSVNKNSTHRRLRGSTLKLLSLYCQDCCG